MMPAARRLSEDLGEAMVGINDQEIELLMAERGKMRIGILALQGAFAETHGMLRHLGAECFEIRKAADLNGWEPDGLVIPGGERHSNGKNSCMALAAYPLRDKIADGLPYSERVRA